MAKALVVGLGSMGTRRVRIFTQLGYTVYGFDLKQERVDRAVANFKVTPVAPADLDATLASVDYVSVSVSPNQHEIYLNKCLEAGKPVFCEASVILGELPHLYAEFAKRGVKCYPSSSMCFHAGIKTVTEIVKSGRLGKLSSYIYHSGQHLEEWHPYESVADFYVSTPEMSGCREIVPFELTWLFPCFGVPDNCACMWGKTVEIAGAPLISDTYSMVLKHSKQAVIGTVIVDTVSRWFERRLVVNGDKLTLVWDWSSGEIRLVSDHTKEEIVQYGVAREVLEAMYVDEIKTFIGASQEAANRRCEEDEEILRYLLKLESTSDRLFNQ